jgi:hypothetical protein
MLSHGKFIVFNPSRSVHDFRPGTAVHQGCLQPNRGLGVFAPTIQWMIQRGMSPITINTYARAINAFLRWLHEEGKCSTLVVILAAQGNGTGFFAAPRACIFGGACPRLFRRKCMTQPLSSSICWRKLRLPADETERALEMDQLNATCRSGEFRQTPGPAFQTRREKMQTCAARYPSLALSMYLRDPFLEPLRLIAHWPRLKRLVNLPERRGRTANWRLRSDAVKEKSVNQFPTAMLSVCVPLAPFKVKVNGAAPPAVITTTG